MSVALAFIAMLIELAVGYPERLAGAIGHPVTWIGALIGRLDRTLNHDADPPSRRRNAGIIALAILLAVAGLLAVILQQVLLLLPFGFFIVALLASSLTAQRSLHAHVRHVAEALDKDGLETARTALSQIVGRDTQALDTAGIARAAIESLAENFSDGIVAPVLWLAIAGLPGAALYKAVNTADSMIGHRTARHQDFGWAAARLDDVVNWPAARLAALLLAAGALLTGDSASGAWRTIRRDAAKHRSPNAGYPEAAIAGALGLALGGPRSYGGVAIDAALLGDGRRDAVSADIHRALALYRAADAVLLAALAVGTAFFIAQA
jgi:adenosylcobinamide-phosphate synthase